MAYVFAIAPSWYSALFAPTHQKDMVTVTPTEVSTVNITLFSGTVTETGITINIPDGITEEIKVPKGDQKRLTVQKTAGGNLELRAAGSPVTVVVTGTKK